jgi:hypothetical protein
MKDVDEKAPVKLFTLQEANSLIPRLRPLIKSVVKTRAALLNINDEIQKARNNAKLGGGSAWGAEYLSLLSSFTNAIRDIEEMGVLVKDFHTGLCDFPHLREGRIIYLCWKMDEDEIRYWHEIEAGFAGRQPIGE